MPQLRFVTWISLSTAHGNYLTRSAILGRADVPRRSTGEREASVQACLCRQGHYARPLQRWSSTAEDKGFCPGKRGRCVHIQALRIVVPFFDVSLLPTAIHCIFKWLKWFGMIQDCRFGQQLWCQWPKRRNLDRTAGIDPANSSTKVQSRSTCSVIRSYAHDESHNRLQHVVQWRHWRYGIPNSRLNGKWGFSGVRAVLKEPHHTKPRGSLLSKIRYYIVFGQAIKIRSFVFEKAGGKFVHFE